MNKKKITKKELERVQGLETNLDIRCFDSPLPPEEYRTLHRLPVQVILDNLRSAFNVGSIIRTADCARIEKVHFCGYTAHPPHGKLEKTALGTMEYVPWAYHKNTLDAVCEIRDTGHPLIAMETTDHSHGLWNFKFPPACTLVMGNEALGVSPDILREADDIIEIPMMGFKNSINVAVAFGIVTYEIQRQYWACMESEWLNNRKILKESNYEKNLTFLIDHRSPGIT